MGVHRGMARWERRAALDVGSHSVRWVVADCLVSPGEEDVASGDAPVLWREVERGRIGAHLGEGWREGEPLLPAAAERAVKAVRHAAAPFQALGAVKVEAAATGVVREARDGLAFLERLRQETGISVRLLRGEEEADLSFRGVVAGLAVAMEAEAPAARAFEAASRRLLVIDIGGGSTEWLVGRVERVASFPDARGEGRSYGSRVGPYGYVVSARHSMPLGAERLTEAFIHGDPPLTAGWDALLAHAKAVWDREGPGPSFAETDEDREEVIVVGGTVTTIATLAAGWTTYERERLQGWRLTGEAVREWAMRLAALPREERLRIPGLPPERVDVIPAGTAILHVIIGAEDIPYVQVGQWDLLEGLIFP